MKLIKPSEIGSKIYTLVEESDERVIVLSPYINITSWYNMADRLKELGKRGIEPEIFVREAKDNSDTYNCLDTLGLKYTKLPNLHAKLYLNEKYGIVTSMNLMLSSEINSLEFGCISETEEEHAELLSLFERHVQLKLRLRNGSPESEMVFIDSGSLVQDKIEAEFNQAWSFYDGDVLKVNLGIADLGISVLAGSNKLKLTSSFDGRDKIVGNKFRKRVRSLTGLEVRREAGNKGEEIVTVLGDRQLEGSSVARLGEAEIPYVFAILEKWLEALREIE